MMNIKIICVGKLKEQFYIDAEKEYAKRLSGYCGLEIIEVSEHRLPVGPSEALIVNALEKERIVIERRVPAGAVSFALCVEGREFDSCGLSEMLMDCAGRGASRLCFIIGGSFGLHEGVKSNADVCFSLSKMTFPHNLARIMLLEQLYRAFNIAEGGKYHKGILSSNCERNNHFHENK